MNIMSILGLDIGDVGSIVNNALRALTAWLCELIYPGIKLMYEVFSEMGQLAFSDSFNEIYKKISLVLGIFMIFRITFWLIELMLSPEKLTDKEKNPGKILIKVLTVVVLLATTPTIFQYAMNIQQKVLESKIIERVINVTNEETMDISTSGGYLAANLFNNFYTKGEYTDENDDCVEFYVGTNGSIAEALRSGNKVSIGNSCLYKTIDKVEGGEEIEPYVIDFNGLFAVAVGGFTFWMILMYCISVGTRYIQLVFLQVIAPIPIMCYIAPGKDNMFQKWIKQCTTTYLDVFIRVAIINFVILLSRLIFANDNNIILSSLNSSASWVIQVLLVLGLLTFAKKAPDLIQELLPKSVTKASGDFGLSWKKRTESMLGGKMIYGATRTATKAATAGVATGAVTGAIGFLGGRGTGRITGLLGGTLRGFGSGTRKGPALDNLGRSIKHQNEVNKRKIDLANNGSTFVGRTKQRVSNALGYAGTAEQFENRMSEIDTAISQNRSSIAEKKRQVNAYQQISDAKSKAEDRAENKLLTGTFDPGTYAYQLQQQVLRAKNAVEVAKQSGADATTIANLEASYNATLKTSKENYITGVIKNDIKDTSMKSTLTHANNIIADSIARGEDTFRGITRGENGPEFDGTNVTFLNYADLDNFEGTTTTRKNDLNEGKTTINANGEVERTLGILGIEEQNQELENEKAEIQASDEYKQAKADRDAVGGHHGK